MSTIKYEDKLTVEINELESLLLEMSNYDTLNKIYAIIDGRLDGKKKIRKTLIESRKNGGQIPVYEV